MAKNKNNKVETTSVENVIENAERKVEVAKKIKKELDKNTLVSVMNFTNGGLTYVSKRTGIEYRWEEFGDIQEMELSELQYMVTSRPRFIKKPFVIILDDEIVEYLNLTNLYNNLIMLEDIDEFFKLPVDEIRDKLIKAPAGVQEIIINRAKELVAEGNITVGRQRVIEEITHTKLYDGLD